MISLGEVKDYLRVTYDDDDKYLGELINIASDYLDDGITGYKEKLRNSKFARKAKMVSFALIQQLYDERYMLGRDDVKVNYMIRSMIFQLENGDFPIEEEEYV